MNGAPPEALLSGPDLPASPLPLDPRAVLSIGRDPACALCLPQAPSLSRRHAEIRPRPGGEGWEIRDLGSANGTWVGSARVRGPRALRDGDVIHLGRRGPVLRFRQRGPAAAAPPPGADVGLVVGGHRIPPAAVRSVEVRSRRRHPHMFSWWLLACLGGLLLLPLPLLFWPWQLAALALAVLLGSRKQHTLELVLRDGRAERRGFANRRTALAHRDGIRRTIGQSPGA